MALPPTEFVQLERDGKLMFEKDLFELSKLLGRPAPEFIGTQVDALGHGNLCWRIESSVRRNIQSPGSRTLVFVTMATHWGDGLCRAMERLLARLCEEHKAKLVNSRFRFYGRRTDDGHPVASLPHPTFGEHILDMRVLLHTTQEDLMGARLQSHFQRIALKESHDREAQLKQDKIGLLKRRTHLKKVVAKLRQKVAEQEEIIEDMEHHVNEIEEEGEDLRKENNAFLSDDDDFLEEMDYEMEDDEEELVDEEEEPLEAVLEDEEEDPEEPPYQSDADAAEPEVPPQ
jgi:hypothetical protein